jgi:hypothetical protein
MHVSTMAARRATTEVVYLFLLRGERLDHVICASIVRECIRVMCLSYYNFLCTVRSATCIHSECTVKMYCMIIVKTNRWWDEIKLC